MNYISNFISAVVGVSAAPPPDVEGDNLAELWVNFLLVESEEKNKVGFMSAPFQIPNNDQSSMMSSSPLTNHSSYQSVEESVLSSPLNEVSTVSRDSDSPTFDCPTFSRTFINSTNLIKGPVSPLLTTTPEIATEVEIEDLEIIIETPKKDR